MLSKTKIYTKDGTAYKLTVNYGFHQIGNQRPYFSITAEQYRKGTGGRYYEDCFGCCHDLIARRFPELAELIPFHLSDCYAIPMHYVANAVYWAELAAGVSKWQDTTTVPHGHDTFADVFFSHCVPIDETDREDLFKALASYRLTAINWCPATARPDLEAYLASRIDRLRSHMAETMQKHGIEVPTVSE